MYIVIRLIPVPMVIEELLVEDIAQLCNIRVASNIVGKQTPCMLSFVYMSYAREYVHTAHNFRSHALLYSL